MNLLPLIIIALCEYTSIAANNTTISLDVNTREETDQVKVTKIESGNMIIYKIEPKGKYKIGKFVDGQTVIYTPDEKVNYKYIEIKCSKANEDAFIARFKYSQGCFCTAGVNYFLFKDGWKKMSDGFYDYIVYRINNKLRINRLEDVVYYNTYLVERSKEKTSLDVSDTNQVSDLVLDTKKEGDLDIRTYKVKDGVVIYTVKSSSTSIWIRQIYSCGCYEVVVYYLGQAAEIIILTVKDYEGTKILYYKKDDQSKYSSFEKDSFDDELKILKEKKVDNTTNTDNTTNNNNSNSN